MNDCIIIIIFHVYRILFCFLLLCTFMYIYIHCNKNFTPTDLKLTDISGKEWPYFSSWQPNENTISITLNKSLPRGLYIISMTDKIRTFSKKIAITE